MKTQHRKGRPSPKPARNGASQRQLRAGELVRHALVRILHEEDIQDEAMAGVSVTVTEVRLSPDLRNATVFVEPLGGAHAEDVVKALNRHTGFLRGRLGHAIDMKFTPALTFRHDVSFEDAARMARLFDNPKIREDLAKVEPEPAFEAPKPLHRVTPKVPSSKFSGLRTTAPRKGGNDDRGA